MQAAQAFGFEQVATEIIRGIMETVDKPHLSPERKSAAQQTLVCTIMAFNPRDPLETTIAGQCLVYDHIMRDGAHDLLRGQHEEIKIKNRASILGTGKLFLQTMTALNRMQGRAAKSLAFAKAQEAQPAGPPAQPSPQPALGEDDAAPIAARAPAPPPPLTTEAAAPVQPAPSPELPPNAPPPPVEPPPAMPTPAVPLNLAPPRVMPSNTLRARQAGPQQPAAPTPPAAVQNVLVPRQQGLAASGPMMSLEAIEDALLAGLTPEEKQSVREGIVR